jgi:hypothetical protein
LSVTLLQPVLPAQPEKLLQPQLPAVVPPQLAEPGGQFKVFRGSPQFVAVAPPTRVTSSWVMVRPLIERRVSFDSESFLLMMFSSMYWEGKSRELTSRAWYRA